MTKKQPPMTAEQIETAIQQLEERFGFINGYNKEHASRIHFQGIELSGSNPLVDLRVDKNGDVYIVICLDPMSPVGEFLKRYCIPFTPDPDFHFEKSSLWIYPVDKEHIRIELRIPENRRFADNLNQIIEMIHGVQIKAEDVYYLKILE
jgi:hypothetical protein